MHQYAFVFLLALQTVLRAQPTAILSGASSFCSGSTYSFSLSHSIAVTGYTWSVLPFSTVIVSGDHDATLYCHFSNGGGETIRVDFEDVNGTQQVRRSIAVASRAKAAFNASLTNNGYPTELVLTNFSSNEVGNYWIYNNNATDVDTSFNTRRSLYSSGPYSIKLIALGKGGCNDTSSYVFRVEDSSGITLPNVFTPNEDGINDFYKPDAKGIYSLVGHVYDRYGTEVASWDKVHQGWDGHTDSGEKCSEGVYFVIIDATGFDGRKFKMKSTVTLIR